MSLPADSLREAQKIAHARNATLSAIITEALDAGLRLERAAERSDEVLASYRKAFSGFSEEEIAALDGIILASSDER